MICAAHWEFTAAPDAYAWVATRGMWANWELDACGITAGCWIWPMQVMLAVEGMHGHPSPAGPAGRLHPSAGPMTEKLLLQGDWEPQ